MRVAGNRKITYGHVIQVFNNDGECVDQEFVAGDIVEWEDDNCEPIDEFDEPEYSYEMLMIQPPQRGHDSRKDR